MNLKNIKIAFLLGSGISICAGAPNTIHLTQSLLNNERKQCTEKELLIKDFLGYIKSLIEDYYKWLEKANDINYEDIYYFVWQLWDSANRFGDNPAIFKLYNEIQSIFPLNKRFYDIKKFQEFLKKVLRYIENFICQKLELKLDNSCSYLSVIKQTYDDKRVEKIAIFSLNHDTLVEQFLSNNKIEYSDGFKYEDSKKIRTWDIESFNNDFKVNLYKLHGSVNWRQFDIRKGEGLYSKGPVGSTDSYLKNTEPIKNQDGTVLIPEERCGILIGTSNKIFNYLSDVFIELNYRFHKILKKFDYLVISGYSFNDKGVNLYINRFMKSLLHNNKKLKVIDPNSHVLENKGEISDTFGGLVCTMKDGFVYKKFENIQLKEILEE
jgi:hypothetical protein